MFDSEKEAGRLVACNLVIWVVAVYYLAVNKWSSFVSFLDYSVEDIFNRVSQVFPVKEKPHEKSCFKH